MKSLLFPSLFVGSVVLLIPNPVRAEVSAIDAVLRADAARLEALQAGDIDRFSEFVSDDLLFIHSDGRLQTKAEYAGAVLSGDVGYENVRTYDQKVMQASDDVVVVRGRLDMRKRNGAQKVDQHLMFLAVWRNESGTWRLFAYQSARPPGNDPIPVP